MAVTDEDTVVGVFRVKPTRKMKGSFNEEKLTIGVPNTDGKGREVAGDMEEEEDSEPFVIEVVAIAEVAVEVREVGGGRVWWNGEREGEGLVLPDVVSGEG